MKIIMNTDCDLMMLNAVWSEFPHSGWESTGSRSIARIFQAWESRILHKTTEHVYVPYSNSTSPSIAHWSLISEHAFFFQAEAETLEFSLVNAF